MSEQTADIVVTTNTQSFILTIDVATISQKPGGAKLIASGQPDRTLTVQSDGSEVVVDQPIPAGDFEVSLALTWPPQDSRDATVDLKPKSVKPAAAVVTVAIPKPTIDSGDTPGFVELFGK